MIMDRSFKLCILLTLGICIPFTFIMIPLYIRHHVFAAYHIPVSSTDSRLLTHESSTFWCQSKTILMNHTFNAYLMKEKPNFENNPRTYWTTKHYQLASEEREYWGFYLPKNTAITLSVCARHPGAKLSVYKGKRNMKKCSNREDDENDQNSSVDEDDDSVTNNGELTIETDEEGSSISSSEEDFLKECQGALFNHSLVPIKNCDNVTNWTAKDIISFDVPTSDYYYFLFSSLNSFHVNSILSKFTVKKSIYNVSHAIEICRNETYCNLPLTFGSSQTVVLEMPDIRDWVVDAGEIICEPRTIVYFPFYVGVPLSILFFAFQGIR